MTPNDHELPAPRPDALVPAGPGPVLVLGPEAPRLCTGHAPDWEARASITEVPDDALYAAVVLADAFRHDEDPGALLERVARLVPPGGTVVVTAPNARSWPVLRGLIEGTHRGVHPADPTGTAGRAFVRNHLVDLVEGAGLRTTALDGTLTGEHAPKDVEPALLGLDLRSAGLAEEASFLTHHVVAVRPQPDAAEISLLDVDATGVSRDGNVEVVGSSEGATGLTARLAEAAATAQGRFLALACGDPDTAGKLAGCLDEWTDVAVHGGALCMRREALFGLGGFGGSYESLDGIVQDLVLRASLGGRRVLRLAAVPDLDGADRDAFLDRHGWVRAVERKDPVPLVTEAGPVNPAGATLTVAMIARDEEDCLEACLSAIKPVADEIVVVDTGSVDRTREIARAHGARVVNFPWCDDFSAARNVSLDAVKTEWALVLDADEVVTPEAVEKIRSALRDTTKAAYLLPLVNEGEVDPDTGLESAVYLLRLFRARPSIRFVYRIHEQVAGMVFRFARRNGLAFSRLPGATIRHTGYDPDVVESRGKTERNRRHFEAQLARYPQDLYSWYKYADFLRECGLTEDARLAIDRAFRLLEPVEPEEIQRLPFAGEVVALQVLELVTAERLEEAWDATKFVAALALDSAHAWYARGLAANRTDRHEEALEAFRRCRAYDGTTAAVPIDPAITGESAALGEAEALTGLDRRDEAREIYDERLKNQARSARALIGLMKHEGDVERALDDYRRLVGGATVPVDARLTGAEALVVIGQTDRAARWLEETGSIDDPQVTAALGEIHLHAGRIEEAHAAWARTPGDTSCRGGAALAAAMLGRVPTERLDHEAMLSLRSYLVNLKRSGRDELFQRAARACVEARLLGGSGGG